MKKISFSRFLILLALFAIIIIPVACGSDDSDPIVQLDPDADGDGGC